MAWLLHRPFLEPEVEAEGDDWSGQPYSATSQAWPASWERRPTVLYYDGHRMVMNTPPLGYILGDEGSGAVIRASFSEQVFSRAPCLPR